jgi:hypothetical protein
MLTNLLKCIEIRVSVFNLLQVLPMVISQRFNVMVLWTNLIQDTCSFRIASMVSYSTILCFLLSIFHHANRFALGRSNWTPVLCSIVPNILLECCV